MELMVKARGRLAGSLDKLAAFTSGPQSGSKERIASNYEVLARMNITEKIQITNPCVTVGLLREEYGARTTRRVGDAATPRLTAGRVLEGRHLLE